MASQDNCEQDGVLPYMSAFKNHVELCLDSFRSLVESLVQSMKDLQFAELYFSPMIPQLGNGLVRLEIWTADIRINDPTFGKPSQPVDITSSQIVSVDLAETKYLTGILVNLKYVLEEVERRMHTMRPLIEKLSGNRFYDVMRKRSLRKRLRGLDQEYQRIAPIIHSLVSSREAFRMEQATKLQRGPLAEILPEIRHTGNDVLRSTTRTDSPSRIGRKISFPDPVEAGLSEDQDPKPTTKPRKHRWERTPQQALALGLYSHHLSVEEINEPNKETNSFEVQLPRWRNHVDVFKDMESELGFVATLRLDRIGMKKNWQRRLGYNYKVLYVKGKKPVWN